MKKGNPNKQTIATKKYQEKVGLVGKTYKLKKELVKQFAEACEAAGVSQAGQLSKMMREFVERIKNQSEEIKMKVYFEKTNGNNNVIITDGETAKIYDGAPTGIYEGIDLYAVDATEQLKKHFAELYAAGELNDYSDIYSSDELDFSEIADELEDAELIFEN